MKIGTICWRACAVGVALLTIACRQVAETHHIPTTPAEAEAEVESPPENYNGYKMAPYKVKGMRFVPMQVEQALRYSEVGVASHYEANGARGAIGQRLYRGEYYAAHRTLPLPCVVRVTNVANGRSCEVRVADRGPYIAGRLIDVSSAVAKRLDFYSRGLAKVKVEVLSVGDGTYKRVKK